MRLLQEHMDKLDDYLHMPRKQLTDDAIKVVLNDMQNDYELMKTLNEETTTLPFTRP